MANLLELISAVDNVPLEFEHDHAPYYRLLLAPDPRPHGFIHPDVVAQMPWTPSFSIDHDLRTVSLAEDHGHERTASGAFQDVVDAAISGNLFPDVLAGRHSEHYRIQGARSDVRVERFAAALFGIATRGAHLTAYVPAQDDGEMKIWVARRSSHLFTYPGMLDSTVAGGVKADDSPRSCMLAECDEEASMPTSLVGPLIRPAGTVSAVTRNPRSGLLHGDVVHVFDLAMPPAAPPPSPNDDEVAEFVLMGCAEVRRRMEAHEFKPNVCLVLIDFFVRHGLVTPETEGEAAYVEICSRLRRRLPMPTMSDV